MRNKNANCGSCPWYFAKSEECRRNPPTVIAIDITDEDGDIYRIPTSPHPKIEKESWCGAHPDLFIQQGETFMGAGIDDDSDCFGGDS